MDEDDRPSLWQQPSFTDRLLDCLYDGVYFVDPERKITYWNRAAQDLTGHSASEAVGRSCFDNLLMHVDDAGNNLCELGCPLAETLRDGKARRVDLFLHHKSGHRVSVSARIAPVRDEHGAIIGAVEAFNDNSAKRHAERRVRELETLAFQDPLTGVANRRYIELKLEQAIHEQKEFGRRFGLLMIDIDHFKEINDIYGHGAGDHALKVVSATLGQMLRAKDIIGRWGGDEFLVLLTDAPPSLYSIAERCGKVISAASTPMDDSSFSITVSIGATLLLVDDSPFSAISRVDDFLYESKKQGRNRSTAG